MHSRSLIKHLTILGAAGAALTLTGCASIFSSGPAKVSVDSRPSGARVTVIDQRTGTEVEVATTPTVLRLKRGAGYFKAAQYRLHIEKDGFRSTDVELSSSVNGWYFGNLLIGGLLGMLVVDPLTGSMYSIEPKNIDQVLEANPATVGRSEGGPNGLIITLLSDVPESLRDSLRPLAVH